MNKLNHETRFKTDLELDTELDILHKSFGQGIKKSDFNRAIFILGFKEFKNKINEGFYPSYEFVNRKTTIKLRKKTPKLK